MAEEAKVEAKAETKEEPFLVSQTYRLYPEEAEIRVFVRWLGICAWLWNQCIEVRKKHWEEIKDLPPEERKKKPMKDGDLTALVTRLRHTYKSVSWVDSRVTREVASRVNASYKGFFRSMKVWKEKGCNPKMRPNPPDFTRVEDFNQLDIWQPDALSLLRKEGSKFGSLNFGTMKDLKVRVHRTINGDLRSASIMKEPDGWYVRFSFALKEYPKIRRSTKEVGINLAVRNLVTRTDGKKVEIPRARLYAQAKTIARLDHIISRRKPGSNRRAKMVLLRRKAFQRLVRMRDHFLGKWAHRITRDFGKVIIEDMDLAKMIEESGGKKFMKTGVKAKTIINASIGKFVKRLEWKSEERNRNLVKVEPQYTTMTCSKCGHVGPKIPLHIRTFKCEKCGFSQDREINASWNDLGRARTGPTGTGPAVRGPE
jgi:putative transposase